MPKTEKIANLDFLISSKLKNIPEQQRVVGPLVAQLVSHGWEIDQIIFGKHEWRIPKSPSQATKREKGQSFDGFPVDIAVFDSVSHVGDPRHLLFIIECKQPEEKAGITHLEAYFTGEPHARLGIWANSPIASATAVFLYRKNERALLKRARINDLPRPNEKITPDSQRLTFNDLIAPTEQILKRAISDLLDKVVMTDSNVTRREEQLDQLCNLILLKLESDKQGKSEKKAPLFFRPMASHQQTANAVRERYAKFVDLYPEVFASEKDKILRFNDETVSACVEELAGLRLIDLGVSTIALAFQVLRSEALKQNEGQYFTPHAVIEAGVRLLKIQFEDIVLDPACGTGGFLVEVMLDMQKRHPDWPLEEVSKWAQTHIYGIEKDAIGVKLTKAIMQIAGDGSAHCVRGDSVRVHNWNRDFPHLNGPRFQNGRFTVVLTNPPFGQNLKVSAEDSRLSQLDLAKTAKGEYEDLEIGLLFLQRAHQLLRIGGRVGIVLPETYFFSSNYSFLFEWMKERFQPVVVANIPMEAFQGFCRAKTNFYVLEKIA